MSQLKKTPSAGSSYQGTLGTFAGVFTPSILTILGIILFLRLGFVVGNGGLGRALIIIAVANAISVLTSFSLSAIATNLRVKGGGDYYLISRTLGVEYGGAIGIVLFLAQSVSVAFYCIGFGEALAGILGYQAKAGPQIIAAVAVAFLFIFAWLGADWATKFQYVVMATLGTALVSFFTGGLMKWETVLMFQNWSPNPSSPGFWALFAIFFPAVTGFTQGVSMSGDLKDPGKSLPLGTFVAVGLSILVYFGAAVVLSASLPRQTLAGDYGAMAQVSVFGFLVSAGVVAATLSSAMASFLGAPRILQSLAGDRIFPMLLPFSKGAGPTNNPRRGVLLTAGIAFSTIALGNLNLIAPVVSMFFLISYGLLNYATYFEARSASPSFRPRFRWYDKRLSLLGFLGCLGTMLAIDLTAGIIAVSVLFAVYQYLKRTAGPARWADSRRSYHLQRVRENLIAAAGEPAHPRDWRPQVLAFSDHAHRRERLLRFSSWIEGGSGLTTVVRVLEGEGIQIHRQREEAEKELAADVKDRDLRAFPRVVAAPDFHAGIHALVQAYGLGPLKANTILLNWLDQRPEGMLGLKTQRYGRNLRAAFRFGCNIIVLDANEEEWQTLLDRPPGERRIDIWWWAGPSSQLMLLLAYLMTRSPEWETGTIRVLACGLDGSDEEAAEHMHGILQEARIDAAVEIIGHPDTDTVAHTSAGAALVFFPFRLRGPQLLDPFGNPLDDILPRLPVTALVLAAQDIELDAQPEEGEAGELAEALDALTDAETRAKEAEKEAEKASEDAEKIFHEIEETLSTWEDEELVAKIRSAIGVKRQAEKTVRKAAKARAKVQDALKTVEKLGAKPDGGDPE